MKGFISLAAMQVCMSLSAFGQSFNFVSTADGAANPAANSRADIIATGGNFTNCYGSGGINPPATQAFNCRVKFGSTLVPMVYLDATKIQVLLPNTHGTANLWIEYYDAADDYWYVDRLASVTVYDFNPRVYDYESSSAFYVKGDLYSSSSGCSNYTFYKAMSAAGNNPASRNGCATISVLYFTGGDSNVDLVINGQVDNTNVLYKGASGIDGIQQINFYTPTADNNYGIRRSGGSSNYTGQCGTGCHQSFVAPIQNWVLF